MPVTCFDDGGALILFPIFWLGNNWYSEARQATLGSSLIFTGVGSPDQALMASLKAPPGEARRLVGRGFGTQFGVGISRML
jgi:hypothetical protein